jgi:hypothetical protein
MTPIPTSHGRAAQASGVTISLGEEQLKSLGLDKLPAEGAQVQMRGTAIVNRSARADDGARDTDHDAGADAQGGDADADDAAESGESDDAAVVTLHITGLELAQARRAPDKVLYGGGD